MKSLQWNITLNVEGAVCFIILEFCDRIQNYNNVGIKVFHVSESVYTPADVFYAFSSKIHSKLNNSRVQYCANIGQPWPILPAFVSRVHWVTTYSQYYTNIVILADFYPIYQYWNNIFPILFASRAGPRPLFISVWYHDVPWQTQAVYQIWSR